MSGVGLRNVPCAHELIKKTKGGEEIQTNIIVHVVICRQLFLGGSVTALSPQPRVTHPHADTVHMALREVRGQLGFPSVPSTQQGRSLVEKRGSAHLLETREGERDRRMASKGGKPLLPC